MPEIKSLLHPGLFSANLEDIKKRNGKPPWNERVVVSDQVTGTVICQAPGTQNDRHFHIYDEWWMVLEGEIHWEIEGQPQLVRAKAGDFVYVPKNHFHLIHVEGDGPAIRMAISVTGEKHRHEKDSP